LLENNHRCTHITHHMARLSRIIHETISLSFSPKKHSDMTSETLDSMRVGCIDELTTISVWGIHRHSNRHTPQGSASCVQSFDDSLIVQFALRIAFRCVLHRCRNL